MFPAGYFLKMYFPGAYFPPAGYDAPPPPPVSNNVDLVVNYGRAQGASKQFVRGRLFRIARLAWR